MVGVKHITIEKRERYSSGFSEILIFCKATKNNGSHRLTQLDMTLFDTCSRTWIDNTDNAPSARTSKSLERTL